MRQKGINNGAASTARHPAQGGRTSSFGAKNSHRVLPGLGAGFALPTGLLLAGPTLAGVRNPVVVLASFMEPDGPAVGNASVGDRAPAVTAHGPDGPVGSARVSPAGGTNGTVELAMMSGDSAGGVSGVAGGPVE